MFQFDFLPYRRSFKQPLQTSHGSWSVREGIIVRLIPPDGLAQFGEIAPLPWFGSETLAEALEFCRSLPPKISRLTIQAIPDRLPACQFGFESALLLQSSISNQSIVTAGLLPTGEAALGAWRSLYERGFRIFKWKIGVADLETELTGFRQLVRQLPSDVQLRLDANGGLTIEQAQRWLDHCAEGLIEYLEQPLAIDQFDATLRLSQTYPTPIALDESIATVQQLQTCYQHGWRGIYVIKPAIAGFPSRLQTLCQRYTIDTVFSSVFETSIGRNAGIHFAIHCGTSRALGYGTDQWFVQRFHNPFEGVDAGSEIL
ncbi:o-succinylbenzoate synthase [Alkalinema pantanalense CENA528]|uniref:o-succinylbenzoate synthase n=1 Tax=Alkalinema pantanalense TaxID=1620705 RepID=UPI003D6DB91F